MRYTFHTITGLKISVVANSYDAAMKKLSDFGIDTRKLKPGYIKVL